MLLPHQCLNNVQLMKNIGISGWRSAIVINIRCASNRQFYQHHLMLRRLVSVALWGAAVMVSR